MDASFGLAGLAASLGAKDLVSDIIAGFTLMTDGSYKVGDTIEIDGFDGAVLKINMRKTTVMDKKGTVKTFSNSTITSVINHSLYPYIYWLEFLLPQECTVKMADEIINRELPKLIGKCPLIIDGPRYSGVSEVIISTGVLFTKIFVDAVCNYPDRYDVQYFLNTELKRIFENELIKDNTME